MKPTKPRTLCITGDEMEGGSIEAKMKKKNVGDSIEREKTSIERIQ